MCSFTCDFYTFVLQHFTTMCLRVDLLVFKLHEICGLSWWCRLAFFIKSGYFYRHYNIKIFIFELEHMSSTRRLHHHNSIHVTMSWTNSCPPPPTFPVFGGIHYTVFIYKYVAYFDPLYTTISFPIPLLPVIFPRQSPFVFMSQ